MSDKILQLTDDGFDNDVINAAGPVLVDFGQNGVVHVNDCADL